MIRTQEWKVRENVLGVSYDKAKMEGLNTQ
jgi:hypothetical protein